MPGAPVPPQTAIPPVTTAETPRPGEKVPPPDEPPPHPATAGHLLPRLEGRRGGQGRAGVRVPRCGSAGVPVTSARSTCRPRPRCSRGCTCGRAAVGGSKPRSAAVHSQPARPLPLSHPHAPGPAPAATARAPCWQEVAVLRQGTRAGPGEGASPARTRETARSPGSEVGARRGAGRGSSHI